MLVCFISFYTTSKEINLFFSPELIFFVAIKVLFRFINHFHVKGTSFNLSFRTWVRDKYIFSQLSKGESYGFEAWSQEKSYRNLQKVRESFSKNNSPTQFHHIKQVQFIFFFFSLIMLERIFLKGYLQHDLCSTFHQWGLFK